MQACENEESEVTKRVGQKKSSSGLFVQHLIPHKCYAKNKTECSPIFFSTTFFKVDSENRMRCDLMSKNIHPKNKTERSPICFLSFFKSR